MGHHNQALLVARDRMGKKPLYYLKTDSQFAFASEIKALLTLPDVSREVRLDAVHDFFAYQYVPDPKTIFTDIHKLPPAHYMWVSQEGIQIEQYWDVSYAQQVEMPEEDYLEKIGRASCRERV